MKRYWALALIVTVSILCGCASNKKVLIGVYSALPDAIVAQVDNELLTTEKLYTFIEREKSDAESKKLHLLPVIKIDESSPYSRLENVIECCGMNDIKTLVISGPQSSFTVNVGPEKREVGESYIFVTLAAPNGTGDIVAGVREVISGESGADKPATFVSEFYHLRKILSRIKERFVERGNKSITTLIDPRNNVPLSKIFTMLSICKDIGLTPEFISPKWAK